MKASFLLQKQQNDFEKDFQQQKKVEKSVNHASTLLSLLLIFIPVSIVVFMIVNNVMYMDVPNLCFIKMKRERMIGKTDQIRLALKQLRKESKDNYEMVCNNVNKVVYGRCFTLHKSYSKAYYLNTNGCYLKGSKIVFLNILRSDPNYSPDVIADTLVKYANESRRFWTARNN